MSSKSPVCWGRQSSLQIISLQIVMGDVQVLEPQWIEGECVSEKMMDRILGSTSLHLHWAIEEESL